MNNNNTFKTSHLNELMAIFTARLFRPTAQYIDLYNVMIYDGPVCSARLDCIHLIFTSCIHPINSRFTVRLCRRCETEGVISDLCHGQAYMRRRIFHAILFFHRQKDAPLLSLATQKRSYRKFRNKWCLVGISYRTLILPNEYGRERK